MNKRIEAMEWWNKLTFPEREEQLKVNCDKILNGDKRLHTSLTGREIEILYHLNKFI